MSRESLGLWRSILRHRKSKPSGTRVSIVWRNKENKLKVVCFKTALGRKLS